MADDPLTARLQRALGTAYVLERELGGGGMSRVYLAEEVRFRRRVVVKLLSPELAQGVSAERFEREMALAASLQQANIVPVLTAGDVDGLPWYTMPYVEGETLRARLAHDPVPLEEAVRILGDVARALAYAHERGVVHRDIKPENVLLSSGTAMVTDFGIAKAVRAAQATAGGSALTMVGTSLGTPAYMAPEQVAGEDVDLRADLYAWGVIGYELLAGRHPFAAKTSAQQLMAAHLAEAPLPLTLANPAVPPRLAALVERALAKAPEDRPASAAQLLQALDDRRLYEPIVARAPGAARAARRARLRNVLVAAVAIAVGGSALWVGARRDPVTTQASGGETDITTVAVLPFVDTDGDTRDEYFSDGMTDELAHALSTLPGLRVAGRTSSYAYKGRNVPAAEIGRALGVTGLVEGTVRRDGSRLRVTAQLTSAVDGKVLWSDSYQRAAGDVFTVQDELTRAIVAALAPALRGERASAAAGTSRGTADAAAYDLYLRGQYLWARRGEQNLVHAADYFRRAGARDPRFARAFSGYSLALSVLPFYAPVSVDSVESLAVATADRAITLDPALAEGHLARGRALDNLLRAAEAEEEYRRAIAIDPQSATAHHWRSATLVSLGRMTEGLADARRARELDPLSAVLLADGADVLNAAGRVAESLAEGRRALTLDSSLSRARQMIATAYALGGHADSAVLAMAPAYRRDPTIAGAATHMAYAYAAAGRWADAERVGAEYRRHGPAHTRHGELAALATVLGDRETALAELERSVTSRDLIFTSRMPNCDPLFVPLRGEARFQALLRGLGMAPCPTPLGWPVPARPR